MQLKDGTLEFQELPDEGIPCSPEPSARTSYRVQFAGRKNVFLDFQSRSYPLLDLSEGGVCIALEPNKSMALDGFLSHCNLVLEDDVFTGLEGRVVHYSLGSNGEWTCGIEWLNLKPTDAERMTPFIETMRKEIFNHE